MKLTVFTSASRACKKMHPSGTWEPGGSITKGQAEVLDVAGLEALQPLIEGLTAHQFLSLGILKGCSSAPVATTAAIEDGKAPAGAIARSNEHMELPAAGFMLIDVDDGSEPEPVLQHLGEFMPALAGVRWLVLGSSRHRVTDRAGNVVCQKGGWHLYAEVAGGLQYLPELAKAYESWAQQNGHAQQERNKGGAVVWKYPVDTSVWKSAGSRPVFESVQVPAGFKTERPARWINPQGGPLTIPRPAAVDRAPAAKAAPSGAGKRGKGQGNGAGRERNDHPAVAAYNAATDLEEVLERYGYHPLSASAWATPEQSGASAGAHVYWGDPDTVYHFTSKSALSGKSCTAFDLLVAYEYKGDRAAAFAAVRAKHMPAPADALERDNLKAMGEGARQAWLAWQIGRAHV